VDDVLIDAPYDVSQEMINGLRIDVVVHGRVRPADEQEGEADPYALPRRLSMIRVVDSGSGLSVFDIEERIFQQRERFEVKFAKKKAAEDEYYSNKYSGEAEEAEEADTTVKSKKKTDNGKKSAKKAAATEVSSPEDAQEKEAGRPKRNAKKAK
jgi:hypothetical protein